ncbi:universal stress protein [Rivularia sp. UHCC 0363]|uniref:universal stress protein n=1 Tax=Rivularia sp. UHCC 0363 TaxID=3110244 RepID=UPI002B216AFD|nr:universal stress protein [Rivularia sp. UHCC 0363]MEA5593064.1 universal stress protein [Rivularia sp. UHCC 0363]
MMQNILLAVSGLGHAEEMLKLMGEIPSIQRAKITVLHVVPPQTTAEAMTAKWEEGGRILVSAIQKLQLNPNQVNSVLRQGEPKDVVCQVANEIDADLIIMGSRGLQRLQSILANSVSQYVFQLSSRPMLLVKDDIYVKRINRIMVAIDKSDASKYCLDLALFLLRDIPGGELILTHVMTDLKSPSAETAQVNAEKHPILAAAVAEAQKQGVKTRSILSIGKPGEKICSLASEMNVDLLLLGSPDRRPTIAKNFVDLDKLLGTSLSDYVRINATCPVLLARTAAA